MNREVNILVHLQKNVEKHFGKLIKPFQYPLHDQAILHEKFGGHQYFESFTKPSRNRKVQVYSSEALIIPFI